MPNALPRSALLALLLTLAACEPAAGPAPAETAAPAADEAKTAPAAAQPATTCPDADFASFLKRFQSSVEAQRAATADPLTMESIDSEAMPEPKPVSRQVPLAEVEFPVMLDPPRREAEGLEETVTELGPSEREVTHGIPDTDAQVRFNFRADPCWKLVRISNDMI